MLTAEERLTATLSDAMAEEVSNIENSITSALAAPGWLESPSLWFGVGMVAGAAVVILGGWSLSMVTR